MSMLIWMVQLTPLLLTHKNKNERASSFNFFADSCRPFLLLQLLAPKKWTRVSSKLWGSEPRRKSNHDELYVHQFENS